VQEKVAPSGRSQPSASMGGGSAEGPCEGEGGAVGAMGGWRWGGGVCAEEGRPYLSETCVHACCCSGKIMEKKTDLRKARSANRNPTIYVDTCSMCVYT